MSITSKVDYYSRTDTIQLVSFNTIILVLSRTFVLNRANCNVKFIFVFPTNIDLAS